MAVGIRLPATRLELGEFHLRLARAEFALQRASLPLKLLLPPGKTVDAALADGEVSPLFNVTIVFNFFRFTIEDAQLLEWYAAHKTEVDTYTDKILAEDEALMARHAQAANN